MSVTPRRTLAAGLAALALATPVAMKAAADATPGKSHATTKAPHVKAPHVKAPQTKQLLKAISVKDAQLVRLAAADRTTRLADDNEAAVVANIDADRATLAALRADAEADGSTLDVNATRRTLHDFRVVNYVLSTNIVRQGEGLAAGAVADPVAAAQIDAAIVAALAITAESTKSDVRAARALLHLAEDETDDADAPDDAGVVPPVV